MTHLHFCNAELVCEAYAEVDPEPPASNDLPEEQKVDSYACSESVAHQAAPQTAQL